MEENAINRKEAEQPSRCPACGGAIRPDARFCTHCGKALDAALPLSRPEDAGAPLFTRPEENPEPVAQTEPTGKPRPVGESGPGVEVESAGEAEPVGVAGPGVEAANAREERAEQEPTEEDIHNRAADAEQAQGPGDAPGQAAGDTQPPLMGDIQPPAQEDTQPPLMDSIQPSAQEDTQSPLMDSIQPPAQEDTQSPLMGDIQPPDQGQPAPPPPAGTADGPGLPLQPTGTPPVCSRCGAPLKPAARFCTRCGAQIAPGAPLAPPHGPAPAKKRWSTGKILALVLPLAALVILLATAAGLLIHNAVSRRTVEGTLLLSGITGGYDTTIPCAVQLVPDGDFWRVDSLSLPFGATVRPENRPRVLRDGLPTTSSVQSNQITGELMLQDAPPDQQEIEDYEADLRSYHLYEAVSSDTVYHYAQWGCDALAGQEPDLFFDYYTVAEFYGFEVCWECLDASLDSYSNDSWWDDYAWDDYAWDVPEGSVSDLPSLPTPSDGDGYDGYTDIIPSYDYSPATCQWEGCTNAVFGDDSYCYIHICSSSGCQNPVQAGRSYCAEHLCAYPGCDEDPSYDSPYCYSHACDQYGCQNACIEGGSYCADHTCAISGCTSVAAYGSSYCYSHTCGEFGCQNACIEGGSYCVDHTCPAAGCTNGAGYNSPYCFLHDCLENSCSNPSIDGGSYCADHTCMAPGCTSRRENGGNYCYWHEYY